MRNDDIPREVPQGSWVPGQVLFNPFISSDAKVLFGIIELIGYRDSKVRKKRIKHLASIIGLTDWKTNKAIKELVDHDYMLQDTSTITITLSNVSEQGKYVTRLDDLAQRLGVIA